MSEPEPEYALRINLDSSAQGARLVYIREGEVPFLITRSMPIERARDLARRVQARANRQGGAFTLRWRRLIARTI